MDERKKWEVASLADCWLACDHTHTIHSSAAARYVQYRLRQFQLQYESSLAFGDLYQTKISGLLFYVNLYFRGVLPEIEDSRTCALLRRSMPLVAEREYRRKDGTSEKHWQPQSVKGWEQIPSWSLTRQYISNYQRFLPLTARFARM